MSGWVSCCLREGGGPAGPPAAPRLLSCRDYHYSHIIYFGQMRHDLYERLGELLATRGGGGPAGPLAGPCLLFSRDYHFSHIVYFGQMRHILYERLGELLATRGGAALLDLQLLPASFHAGTTIIHILYILVR